MVWVAKENAYNIKSPLPPSNNNILRDAIVNFVNWNNLPENSKGIWEACRNEISSNDIDKKWRIVFKTQVL